MLIKNLLEQSTPFLPGLHKQIPVDVLQFPALLQFPGHNLSAKNKNNDLFLPKLWIQKFFGLIHFFGKWNHNNFIHNYVQGSTEEGVLSVPLRVGFD